MLYNAEHNINKREDLRTIAEIIPDKASVLDLGCGNGDLLYYLKCRKNIYACGIEVSEKKLVECVKKGVPVIQSDLNDGLAEFTENSFDYVVLSQTLQAVKRPDKLLEDMMRVGKKGIVSFMNIGYISARYQLFFTGRMPVTKDLPEQWYNTPNIHLGTIKDFKSLCSEKGYTISKELPFTYSFKFLAHAFPNLFAANCLFTIEK